MNIWQWRPTCSAAVFTFLADLLAHSASAAFVDSVFPNSRFQSDHPNTHPKTMPPRRPLPDLVLITVFKMLTPNEQMVASEMSPRCSVLVRAANRTVKTLVITDQNFENPNDLDDIRAIVEGGGPATIDQINYYSLASKPAMHPLMSVHGEPSFPDYPMTTHLSKWHCLEIDSTGQIDTATIEQITTIFSAVTDLKFMTIFQKNDKHLVTLLQHPNWQCQLTSLMVYDMDFFGSQVAPELITTAINDLTSLKQLALDWRNYTDLPDLTILGQLKVVAFRSHRVGTFVRSLEQYATDNADLQVHLFSSDSESLLSLSQPLHSRIVHFGHEECFYYLSMVRRLCSQFRFLTSLNIGSIHLTQVGPLFTVLSQLHQLVHLNLEVFWQSEEDEGEEELPAAPRPLAQMNSLRALELRLNITFHSQVEWLNLPVTMPNLQTIHIQEFCCESCKVWFKSWLNSGLPLLNSSEALNCFQFSLFTLHSGVSMRRFILNSYKESISAEKLLLQSE